MALITAQMSVSLDGFYAGPKGPVDAEGPADWVGSPAALGFFGSRTGDRCVRVARAAGLQGRRGAVGRRAAVPGAGVRGHPSSPGDPDEAGGTSFTFVTEGLASAVAQARDAAGGKDVAIAGGGSTLIQVIKAGLLDQLDLRSHRCCSATGFGCSIRRSSVWPMTRRSS